MTPDPLARLLLSLAVGLALAGGAGGAEDEPSWVYASLSKKKAVVCYRLSPASGILEPVHQQALAGPGPLASNRQLKRLYAVNYAEDVVQVYGMTPATGALEPISSVKMSGRPEYLAIDGSGRFLMAAIYSRNTIDVLPLDDQGVPLTDKLQTLPSGRLPHSIRSDRSGWFVYVPCKGSNQIFQYAWNDSRSALLPEPAGKHKAGKGGPRHLWFHPTRDWLYLVNEADKSMSFFRVAADSGALTLVQTLSTFPAGDATNGSGAHIQVTPDGRYVYASNRGHESIAGFAIDAASGELTALGQFATAKGPRAFAIDPSGRCLIAGGTSDGRLVVHGIDRASGKLTELHAYETAGSPVWIDIVPIDSAR